MIVGNERGYHHVNAGSFVGDGLMIERLMVGTGLRFEEEPKRKRVAEGMRSM